MQNSKTNPAKPASQPPLPFSTAPLDFSQPIELRFDQLQKVRHAAERAGFYIAKLKLVPGGYQIECQAKAN